MSNKKITSKARNPEKSDRAAIPSLVKTKLIPPGIASDLVSRSRLDTILEQGCKLPLTLVCAPAGYGKSSLVSNWVRQLQTRHAWISLDLRDDDLIAFLSYLHAAISGVFPNSCKYLSRILHSQLLPVELISDALINDISSLPESLLLVLDDYHRIHNQAVHDLVSHILRNCPGNFHLVLIARFEPALPLASFRGAGLLGEIRASELRMNRSETRAFLEEAGGKLTAVNLDRIEQIIEGWGAGLRLLNILLQQSGDLTGKLDGIEINVDTFEQYMVSEVLAGLPQPLRRMILISSIPDRFCLPLCQALWQADPNSGDFEVDPAGLFSSIGQSGLFIIPLDGNRTWFRFHHLFQELLRANLSAECSTVEMDDLTLAATEWFDSNGYHGESLSLLCSRSWWNLAVGLIIRVRRELMNRERWHELNRWLGYLPKAVREEHAELKMLRAWIYEHQLRYQDFITLIDDIERVLGESPESVRESLSGEFHAMASARGYFRQDVKIAREHAEIALATLPESAFCERGFAMVVLLLCMQHSGENVDANKRALQSLADEDVGDEIYRARTLTGLGFINWMNVRPDQAVRYAGRLMQLGVERGLEASVTFARYLLGATYYDMNSLDLAREALEPVLDEHPPVHISNYGHSFACLMRVELAACNRARAGEVLDRFGVEATELMQHDLIQLEQNLRVEFALRCGNPADASHWARDFQANPSGFQYRFFVPELLLVRYLLAEGSEAGSCRAADLLGELEQCYRRDNVPRLLLEVLLLQAEFACLEGNLEKTRTLMRNTIDLSMPGGVVRPLLDAVSGNPQLLQFGDGDLSDGQRNFLERLKTHSNAARVMPEEPVAAGDLPEGLREPLSNREQQVLECLARRMSNKEIAKQFNIAEVTIKSHVSNIFRKLGVNRRKDAVGKADAMGLIRPQPD